MYLVQRYEINNELWVPAGFPKSIYVTLFIQFLKKKCIVLRSETEWIEPIENNNNILYDYKTPLNEFIDKFLKVIVTKKCSKNNASCNIVNIINNLKLT